MISLRQHLQLVAVFVALAIGIAAGSTVVRGPLLDSTARLESAEENIALERAENDTRRRARPARRLGGERSGAAGGRPLAATGVLVMVVGAVDDDVVDGVLRTLRVGRRARAAHRPAVFDPEAVERVACVLGVTPSRWCRWRCSVNAWPRWCHPSCRRSRARTAWSPARVRQARSATSETPRDWSTSST
ncbi:MAG: copper transporter [Ilumatobacteraceae bacterium]